MEELERAQERLQNIRSVEPILDALRMVALGSWQKARKRKAVSQQYGDRLLQMLPHLLPHLPRNLSAAQPEASPTRRVVVIVGSERGMCGRFNMDIVAYANDYLAGREEQGEVITLAVLGGRARRLLVADGRSLAWSRALPATTLPPLSLAFTLTRQWLQQFEAGQIDAVTCLYNASTGMGSYRSTAIQLLPPSLPQEQPAAGEAGEWPPPIIETDAVALYTHIVQQWTAVRFYMLLLQSASAEHSVRYQVLESAMQNVERLIDELSGVVQAARQQAITREMQALAVGAGLVGPRDEE